MDKQTAIAAAYKTVEMFAGITKRRLFLKNGSGTPRTDGYSITVDFDDPYLYRLTEHELFHILFKSEPLAKQTFVKVWTDRITAVAAKYGVVLNGEKLGEFLHFMVNVGEDHRVNCWGGRQYPGTVRHLDKLSRTIILDAITRGTDPHSSLAFYYCCVFAGVEPDPGPLDRLRPYFQKALDRLQKAGPDETYIVTKRLLMDLIADIIKQKNDPMTGESRAKALNDIMALSFVPPGLADIFDDAQPPQFKVHGAAEEAMKKALAALDYDANNDEALDLALSCSSQEMEDLLDELRARMRQQMTEDDWLRKDAEARVVFRDVRRKDGTGEIIHLDALDSDTVRRLRAVFMRVMGQRKTRLEDAGAEVDIGAVIESITLRQPMPVFKHEQSGRGFRSLVLIDRSGSMEGKPTEQAERACRVIGRALKFPFVRNESWGFQSHGDGQIDVTRFESGMEHFTTDKSKVGGATPLHLAVHLAVKHLEQGTEAKQLFVLTDGHPSHTRKDGRDLSTAYLIDETTEEIHQARQHGINVTGVVIGTEVPDKMMNQMFGHARFWRRLSADTFGTDLVRLVSSSFLSYLKHA